MDSRSNVRGSHWVDEARTRGRARRDKTILKPDLHAWQIFMISIGAVIGITVLSTFGEILRLAGPAGLVISTAFVAVTMICVIDCIAEFVILWPVSNGLVEFVRAFVDDELAIVVGFAYWYAFSCVCSTLIIVAADLAIPFIPEESYRYLLFYAVFPILILIINLVDVKYFGWIEGIGGVIKLVMVVSGLIVLVVKATQEKGQNIRAGFQHQSNLVNSDFEAMCLAIPLLAYGFIGTDAFATTSFEAKDRNDIRYPAKYGSYTIAFIYVVAALLTAICVPHTADNLQDLSTDRREDGIPTWYPVIRIATDKMFSSRLGVYFTWCIIYFCLSAANAALYLSSRTLFGLTRSLNRGTVSPSFLKLLRPLGATSPTTRVPQYAAVASFLAFFWLIPLQATKGYGISDRLLVMGTTASIGAVMVWATQCVAYLRYHHWFHRHKKLGHLDHGLKLYNRWNPDPKFFNRRPVLSAFQPVPAWLGLISCLLIVFVFSSASWWKDGRATAKKVATAYSAPIALTLFYILLKFIKGTWNQKWWKELGDDFQQLNAVIENFHKNKNRGFQEHDDEIHLEIQRMASHESNEGVAADAATNHNQNLNGSVHMNGTANVHTNQPV